MVGTDLKVLRPIQCQQVLPNSSTVTVQPQLFLQANLVKQHVMKLVMTENKAPLVSKNPVRYASSISCVSNRLHSCLAQFPTDTELLPSVSNLQDDMLRKAGKHSWGPNDVVPQGRGGKRLSKLKAPKRQQQQTTALFRRVHAVKESQPLLRGDKQERTDSTSSVRLFPHVSDVWERSSAEAAAAAAGKEMTDVGAYMSSKLTGEMIVKVAIKITQQDGSVFLIRKSGEVRDQVRRRGHAGLLLSILNDASKS